MSERPAYFEPAKRGWPPFHNEAGNTDPGLNSSASAAIIFPKASDQSPSASNAGCLAVTDDGVVYTVDRRGLMRIDVNDGRYRQYIPVTGSTNVGPVSSATLRIRPRRIALDYNDGLLIYDYEQILRLDLKTEVLSVFIGGGSTLADNTLASDYVVTAPTNFDAATTLMPLPNGDVWFTSGLGIGRARNGSHIEVYTASDQRIHWKTPTGTGSKENASFDPSAENVRNYGFGFNPTNSSITYVRSVSTVPTPGGQNVYSVRYNPTTFATMTPQIPYLAYWDADPTITSRLGEMYALDRFEKHGLYKYNSSTNDWDRIVGSGVKGSCPDGTVATSCNVDIYDAFISAQGLIYIVDRNLIRTIDSDGKMLTLFGQSLSFGDGGAGPSARISEIQWLDQTNDGKIVFADLNEYRIREFTPGGSITHLAGTGADAYPNTTDPAATQPVSVKYWGGTYSLVVDQSDNGVIFMRAGARFTKLNRSTGRWVDIAGGGATDYASADGLQGPQIFLNGYPPSPFGYNGSHFISHLDKWDGTQHIDAMIKQYAISDGTQTPLIGKTGPSAGDFSSLFGATPGTNASTISISPNFSSLTRVEWDSSQTAWLIHQPGSASIKPVHPSGLVEATMNFPRGFSAYTRVVKGGDTLFYYCGNDAKIYRYNYTQAVETALAWPSPTIFCSGLSLVWNASRSSVIFPIQQNGLGGLGEIYDP